MRIVGVLSSQGPISLLGIAYKMLSWRLPSSYRLVWSTIYFIHSAAGNIAMDSINSAFINKPPAIKVSTGSRHEYMYHVHGSHNI